MTELTANTLVIDGEVVVQGETGIADFDALQDDLAAGRSERMVCFAFDLLYLDGFDLRKAPLSERQRVLAALLDEGQSECIQLSQHLETEPELVYEQACTMAGPLPGGFRVGTPEDGRTFRAPCTRCRRDVGGRDSAAWCR